MISVSVITLVHGRKQHLKNLITGLSKSSHLPSELVVVHMNESANYLLPETPFPIRRLEVNSSSTKIPLATARNQGAIAARQEKLLFLDVDCIPETTLVGDYEQALSQFNGVVMGTIRYLPEGVPSKSWDFEELRDSGVHHPSRPHVNQLVKPTDRYELFWSLSFAISRQNFEQIGGFDIHYQGYGAEDTDFAFTARKKAVPFALSRTLCYHQHHPVYRPPLQHFQDIIANSHQFYKKWGKWPMEGWLRKFTQGGYIRWDSESDFLEILRTPTSEEIKSAYHEAPAGF